MQESDSLDDVRCINERTYRKIWLTPVATTQEQKDSIAEEFFCFIQERFGHPTASYCLQAELGHLTAYSGHIQLGFRELPNGEIEPFTRLLNPEKFQDSEIRQAIAAAGEHLSDGDRELLEAYRD